MKNLLILSIFIVCNLPQKIHEAETERPNYTIIKFNLDRHNMYFDGPVRSAALSSAELSTINAMITERTLQYNSERKEAAIKQAKKYENKQAKYQLEYYLDLIGPIKKYYKQVVVVINKSGQKEAFINCFCTKPENDSWKKSIGLVMDGGACYFSVKINLTTNSILAFYVNGVA